MKTMKTTTKANATTTNATATKGMGTNQQPKGTKPNDPRNQRKETTMNTTTKANATNATNPAPATVPNATATATANPALVAAQAQYKAPKDAAAVEAAVMGALLHGMVTIATAGNWVRDAARILKTKAPKGTTAKTPATVNWDDPMLGVQGKFAATMGTLLTGVSCSEAAKLNGHPDRVNPVREMLRRVLTAKGLDYTADARLTLNPDKKAQGADKVLVSYVAKAEATVRTPREPKPAAGSAYPVRFKVRKEGEGVWAVEDTVTAQVMNGGFKARSEGNASEWCKLFDKLATFPTGTLKTLANTIATAKKSEEVLNAKAAAALLKVLEASKAPAKAEGETAEVVKVAAPKAPKAPKAPAKAKEVAAK